LIEASLELYGSFFSCEESGLMVKSILEHNLKEFFYAPGMMILTTLL